MSRDRDPDLPTQLDQSGQILFCTTHHLYHPHCWHHQQGCDHHHKLDTFHHPPFPLIRHLHQR